MFGLSCAGGLSQPFFYSMAGGQAFRMDQWLKALKTWKKDLLVVV
jgi:hypothetical protein